MSTGEHPKGDGKSVLVICQLDRYANGLKPVAIEQFLRKRGHKVRLVDTYYLSRASSSRSSFTSKLPSPRPRRTCLYATEVASVLLTRHWRLGRRLLSYYFLDCRSEREPRPRGIIAYYRGAQRVSPPGP